MSCRISKKEWMAVYVVMGVLDFIQFFIIELIFVWFLGAGALVNEIIDPIIGILFTGYLFIRGIGPARHWKCYASILGMEGLEELTGGVAQLWVLDVWYIKRQTDMEKAQIAAVQEEQEMLANVPNQPLYRDGMRMPISMTQTIGSESPNRSNLNTLNLGPLNRKGIRVAGASATGNTYSAGNAPATGTERAAPNPIDEEAVV